MGSRARSTAGVMLGRGLSCCSRRTSRSSSAARASGVDTVGCERARDELDRAIDVVVRDPEVRDGAHETGPEIADEHAVALKPFDAVARVLDLDEVRLDLVPIEADAFGEPARTCVVLGEAVDDLAECVETDG